MPDRTIVFVAENDSNDQLILRKAEQKAEISYELSFFNDGQELLDCLHEVLLRSPGENAFLPRLIMLDLNMPRKNGFEVLEHLRKNKELCKIPVIVLTSLSGEEHKQRSYDLGAKLFLSKPAHLGGYVRLMEFIRLFLRLNANGMTIDHPKR